MTSLMHYINGALEELRHVRWPTRQQAVRFSMVVLAFTGVSAVLFGIVDFLLAELFEYLISLA